MRPRVKRILEERGLSQRDLALRLGVSDAAISRVINGSRISPYLQREIAQALAEDEAALWGDLYWFRRPEGARRAAS